MKLACTIKSIFKGFLSPPIRGGWGGDSSMTAASSSSNPDMSPILLSLSLGDAEWHLAHIPFGHVCVCPLNPAHL